MTNQEIIDMQFDLDVRENQRWNYEQEAERAKTSLKSVYCAIALLKDGIKTKMGFKNEVNT
jgi:hypothetical protein